MKFIHTSDLHIGYRPDEGKSWALDRAQAIDCALSEIVKVCKEKNADLLLISGGLFDKLPYVSDLAKAGEVLNRIPDTQVVIIAGDEDYASVSSPVKTFPWPKNVTYLFNEYKDFEELGTVIYGASYSSSSINSEQFYSGAPKDKKISLLMLHESEEAKIDIDRINKCGYTYAALGGRKKAHFKADNIAFSGSPEPLSTSDTGIFGVMYGIVNEYTHKLTKLERIPISSARYVSLSVSVSPQTENRELVQNLKEELERRGRDKIYKIRIRGMRRPDVIFNISDLKETYKISDVTDETEPKYDYKELFRDHPSDMVGFFVNRMNKEDMSEVEKKALFYGVGALLKTEEER